MLISPKKNEICSYITCILHEYVEQQPTFNDLKPTYILRRYIKHTHILHEGNGGRRTSNKKVEFLKYFQLKKLNSIEEKKSILLKNILTYIIFTILF